MIPNVFTAGLPDPSAVNEYLNDTGADWGIDPNTATFKLKDVSLVDLESAEIRPLRIDQIDMNMVGHTKTKGPLVLDHDYSVIDGMHRLADAVASGERKIQAYIRVHTRKTAGMEEYGTNEEEAHRRAAILEKMLQEPVNWQDFREIIEASEPWDPIQWPEDHDWFIIKGVPLDAFREVNIDAIADVEDRGERREHRERYKAILKMMKKGAHLWPVIVADSGMIIDGYHRLAVLHTLKALYTDVLYVIA